MSGPTLDEAMRCCIPWWALGRMGSDFEAVRRDLVAAQGATFSDGYMAATRRDGLHLTIGDAHARYPWPAVRRRVEAMPADALAALRDLHRAYGEHSRAMPTFRAPVAAQGCGPLPDDEADWTAAQRLYAQAWAAHQPLLLAHHQRGRQIETQAAAMLDRCYGVDEPADLLALIEAAS